MHVIKSNISSPLEGDLKNEIPAPLQNASFYSSLFYELDPHFKSFQVLENYVGHKNIIHLVIEYDVKKVICFLWHLLNSQTLVSKLKQLLQ